MLWSDSPGNITFAKKDINMFIFFDFCFYFLKLLTSQIIHDMEAVFKMAVHIDVSFTECVSMIYVNLFVLYSFEKLCNLN